MDQRRQLFDGLALALSRDGYEGTKVAAIVDLAGISRPTFYEHFESKDDCFAAAYRDAVQRVSIELDGATRGVQGWLPRVSAGLRAGLDLLASDPPLAHLLLVESLAATRPARLEHERTLSRLAAALRPLFGDPAREAMPEETARLLAGGLASYLCGRVLGGEAELLPESYDLLLVFLLTPSLPATARLADERRA